MKTTVKELAIRFDQNDFGDVCVCVCLRSTRVESKFSHNMNIACSIVINSQLQWEKNSKKYYQAGKITK